MQRQSTPLFNRPDTLFGVCEGLGKDIGVHPNIFRFVFIGLLFWNPEIALGVYAALGMIVYFFRWAVPDRVVASGPTQAEPVADNDDRPVSDSLAA